jgi:hypothetical protein
MENGSKPPPVRIEIAWKTIFKVLSAILLAFVATDRNLVFARPPLLSAARVSGEWVSNTWVTCPEVN